MLLTSYKGLRPGNWLFDTVGGHYCVVRLNSQKLVVESLAQGNYEPVLFKLKGIPIKRDNLSLAPFHPRDSIYERTENGIHLVLAPLPNGFYKWWVNEAFIADIDDFHVLQNAFEDATGKLLELNLFGSR